MLGSASVLAFWKATILALWAVEVALQPVDLLLEELQRGLRLAGARGEAVGEDPRRRIRSPHRPRSSPCSAEKLIVISAAWSRPVWMSMLVALVIAVTMSSGVISSDLREDVQLARDVEQVGPGHQPLLEHLELFERGGGDGGRGQRVGDLGRLEQRASRSNS